MPRIRSVSPDICKSETMAKQSGDLERTFVRLWTHCDDEGRCEDRPKLIKANIYPEHDHIDVERLDNELAKLEAAGLIVRYSVAGKGYIAVPSWHEYQHPQKPRKSKYPPPPDDGSSPTGKVRDVSETPSTESEAEPQTPVDNPLPEDDGTDTGEVRDTSYIGTRLEGRGGEGKWEMGNGKEPPTPTASDRVEQAFEILGRRAIASTQNVKDPAALMKSAIAKRRPLHEKTARALASANPTWSAERIADQLEPPPRKDPLESTGAAARKAYERAEAQKRNPCPDCDRGRIETSSGVAPCQQCGGSGVAA